MSGPLNPAPNPSDSRSVALAAVVSGTGGLARLRLIPKVGIASNPSPRTDASKTGTRRRITNLAHREPAPSDCFRCVSSPPDASSRRSDRLMTRDPANPSVAGSSVSEITTATATANAAARPMLVRNGMFTTNSPANAMSTVNPANTTAEPAVPAALPAAISGSCPSRSSER